MGDAGISKLKPQYESSMLVKADLSYWEVQYSDGTTLSEAEGASYRQIDRSRLTSFRIVHGGENVFEAFPPPGMGGHNLVYRRRTGLGASGAGRAVVFIVGWVSRGNGVIFNIDLENNSYEEDAARILPTLTPMPGEPEDLLKGIA